MTVTLPPELTERLRKALERAGSKEIGGVLMGRHVSENMFSVADMSIQGGGTFASFIRQVQHAVDSLRNYFARSGHSYRTHNYLGEWHSHPSFLPVPSSQDVASVQEIATDPQVGANFVVLVIVKLTEVYEIEGSATVFLPNGTFFKGVLEIGAAVAS
jgi:integrative and conjugative element protein (TIGR02256 family)